MSKSLKFGIKIKSFGLVEAIIASAIVAVVLTAMVRLASNSLKNSLLNSAYLEAEHISDDLFEKVAEAKAAEKLVFYVPTSIPVGKVSIDCFDWANYYSSHKADCEGQAQSANIELPYKDLLPNPDGFFEVPKSKYSPAFPPEKYFWFKIALKTLDKLDPRQNNCRDVAGVEIDGGRCRMMETEINWKEASGEKKYFLTQYFADWNK